MRTSIDPRMLVFAFVFLGSAPQALANCKYQGTPTGNPHETQIIAVSVTYDGKCPLSFYTPTGVFDSSQVLLEPAHGDLVRRNRYALDYVVTHGFSGPDTMVVKSCSVVGQDIGCATIVYHFDVE